MARRSSQPPTAPDQVSRTGAVTFAVYSRAKGHAFRMAKPCSPGSAVFAVSGLGTRRQSDQPRDSRLKLALTARLAGFSAALIERSMATPLSTRRRAAGKHFRPEPQGRLDHRTSARRHHAFGDRRALLGRPRAAFPSPNGLAPRLSLAISGRRIAATIGASIRSPAIDADSRALCGCFDVFS